MKSVLDPSLKRLTRGLIAEYVTITKDVEDRAPYTIKPQDTEIRGVIRTSLKRLYLEMGDPTEYLFATKYFDGYPHWQSVLKVPSTGWGGPAFEEVVDSWRLELAAKMKAEAAAAIIKMSKKDSGLTAAKLIASGSLATMTQPTKTKSKATKTENKPKTKLGNDLEMLKALET